MIEVKSNNDINLHGFYVVRNDVLYKVHRYEIDVNETYVTISQAPTVEFEPVLLKGKRTTDKDPFFAFEPREMIIADCLNMEEIKNYILKNKK